jgi:hypothetical protein
MRHENQIWDQLQENHRAWKQYSGSHTHHTYCRENVKYKSTHIKYFNIFWFRTFSLFLSFLPLLKQWMKFHLWISDGRDSDIKLPPAKVCENHCGLRRHHLLYCACLDIEVPRETNVIQAVLHLLTYLRSWALLRSCQLCSHSGNSQLF